MGFDVVFYSDGKDYIGSHLCCHFRTQHQKPHVQYFFFFDKMKFYFYGDVFSPGKRSSDRLLIMMVPLR